MNMDLTDNRDEFEVEFDAQFEEEEVEATLDPDDVIQQEQVQDTTSEYIAEESDADTEDFVGDLRIKNKSTHKTITTAEANDIKAEIAKKEKELEEARVKMQEKREDGDLSENEAYHYFKDKVAGLEADIAALTDELRSSIISDVSSGSNTICKGSKVHIVITDVNGIMKPEDIIIEIVSKGHSGITSEEGPVKVPENSEVYRKMEGKVSGDFILTGTDGNNYSYKFELVR